MKVKCEDGWVREIYPADRPNNQVRVNRIYPTPAYCTHCKEKFSTRPSIEQKETWRKHSCERGLYKWK
jgi:hypothetical protein